jgi:post-segregation antitoxin (ccd killing protein)
MPLTEHRECLVYSVCMARLNVHVPDELAQRARAKGLNVSALTQAAITAALERHAVDAWLDELPLTGRGTSHEAAMQALNAARDEFERDDPAGEPVIDTHG